MAGGIAGLTLAATLDPARWEVTLHERAPDRAPVGTALAMWPDVMAALDQIGVADAVRRNSVLIERFEMTDGHGRPLMVDTSQRADLLTRPHLLAALDAAVPVSVERRTERVTNPATLHADLVVGADGAHSAVRRSLFAGGPARKVGIVALRGLSPVGTNAMVEIWQGGALCGLSPTVGGESNWYLACRATGPFADIDTMDNLAAHRAAVDLADRFGSQAAEVVGATAPNRVLRQDIWVTPPRWRLTSDRAALVGDAAHAMCPNLGCGACESLLDAVTLGRALNTMGIPEALRHYQRTRALRTQGMRAASGLVMRLSMLQRGAGLRDRLLRWRLPEPRLAAPNASP